MDKIRRARALVASGDKRSALKLLRDDAEHEAAPYRSRLALAELYRELRLPDQAGRWGIVFDGWTTAYEQDRLARLMAASGVNEETAAAFLRIPRELDGAADLPKVLASIPSYREQFNARTDWTPPIFRRGWPVRFASAAAKALLYAAGVAALVTVVGVFQQAVSQGDDIRAFAIGGSLWFVGLLAGGPAPALGRRVRARCRRGTHHVDGGRLTEPQPLNRSIPRCSALGAYVARSSVATALGRGHA